MTKAFRAVFWITVVGIALAAQGCWDDQPDGFTLIGEGGCRTADGGDGKPEYVSGVTMETCAAQCRAAKEQCVAFEYNAKNSNCEIHHQPITKVAEAAGVSCYVVK